MGSATDNIFQRLESAISEWSAEIKSSSAGMAEKLARAKDRLGDTPEGAESVEALTASLDFARAEFARLEVSLRECLGAAKSADDRAANGEQAVAVIREEMAQLRQELSEKLEAATTSTEEGPARDEALVAEVEHLKEQLTELREIAEQTTEPETEESLAAVCGELESLRVSVTELRGATLGGEDVTALQSEIQGLKERLTELGETPPGELDTANRADVDELRNAISQLRESLGEAGETARRVEELEGMLAVERDRADRLEQQIATADHPAGISPEAAVELDLFREELAEMRARFLTSGAPSPVPSQEEEVFTAPETPVYEPPPPPSPAEHRVAVVDLELSGFDSDGRRRRMGDILVDAGVLTQEQLEEALREQQEHPQRRLGAILVELGHTESDVIAQVLACQLKLPYVQLEQEVPEESAVRLVNGRLCRHHHCVPVRLEDETVILAMSNPLDLIAIEDIELATSRRVDPVVASEPDIAKAIEWFYGSE